MSLTFTKNTPFIFLIHFEYSHFFYPGNRKYNADNTKQCTKYTVR